MSILTDSIRSDSEYIHLADCLKKQYMQENSAPVLVNGLCEGAAIAFSVSVIRDRIESNPTSAALIFCSDEKECIKTVSALGGFGLRCVFYQSRELTLHNVTVSRDYEHERLKVLFGLLHGRYDVVVTTPDASLGYTMPPSYMSELVISLDYYKRTELQTLVGRLVDAGYTRVELVEGAGQFATRGGIVDIFPPFGIYTDTDGVESAGSYPVRIELFGDEIDRMTTFAPETQRALTPLRLVKIPPSKEIIPDRESIKKLCNVLTQQLRSVGGAEAASETALELASAKAAYESGSTINFIDKYISLVYPGHESLLDYFKYVSDAEGGRPLVMIHNTNAVNERLKATEWHNNQMIVDLLEAGAIAPKYAEFCKSSAAFEVFCERGVTLHIDSMTYNMSGKRLGGMFGFRTRQLVSYAGSFELLCEDLDSYIAGRYKIIVIAENETAAGIICQMLNDAGYNAIKEVENGDYTIQTLPRNVILIKFREHIPSYELFVPKIAVMSTVPDQRRTSAAASRLKQSKRRKKGSEAILSYAELEVGDYVVHEKYGIGRYTGIENLTINGVSRDYFGVQYAGSDRLFLPIEKLDMVSKYIGAHSDDGLVKLDHMGSGAWSRSKARAKESVKEIAKDLIKLYAERSRRPGIAFDPDNDFQADFEASFEYTETDGQLEAIKDIKEDMMRAVPMDRLLCGDVGYGKTEVALRAAFKAVMSGKQVAILVPTTILALQHYQTVQSRFRGFAVNCDMLSRFRTSRQLAKTIRELRRGEIDIIIGTHRLLSKDVEFSDLGLVIIDEEQRFGVAQKEKLKTLAKNVDVLTLTATPIPRTLNMALGGIRDISVLDEAPQDRLPVQTYVLEEDDSIINEAIRRELRRGGQIFYLHNAVDDIMETAGRISAAHPEARVVYAHGKMSKEELESIWAEMLAGHIDILVCTTIIETGVDVPNANTLIVDNAYRLGLSQLHQIRGRVGRSSRRAYAYFTYPKGRALSEIASKRLEAIREYTEFGSGFRIAMRDLEIRGAGDLLGASQHGHLDAIGYELYIKLLNEAVLEEKGEAPKKKNECTVSMEYSAYLPESYVKFPNQRMAMYKKIALIENEADVDDVADELQDRYGEMPESAENLLKIALIRANAAACGMTQITQEGNEIKIYPETLDFDIWSELCRKIDGSLRVKGGEKTYISYAIKKKATALTSVNRIFEKYIEILRRNNAADSV